MFLKTTIELARLQQNAISPILSCLNELYNGLIMFRSLNKMDFIHRKFIKKVNNFINIFYTLLIIVRYVSLTIEIGIAIFMGVSLAILVTGKIQQWSFILGNQDILAVTISMFLYLPIIMHGFTFYFFESFINMISVQRLLFNIDEEDLEEIEGNSIVPETWPEKGAIKAVNVNIRYRPHLPFVLKNISFDIASGERVGVIGRTGSGKSTLLLALTRILEQDMDEPGYFEIDGYQTNRIDLYKLRKSIAVIPQDPFLLKGSLRFNIDPYSQASKEEVIQVLKKAFLWDSNLFDQQGYHELSDISSKPLHEDKKLEFQIDNGGKNISVGQRQLICIARSLLNKPRILLMDEATSNIDPNTDKKLQKLIKEEFNGSTIITIAHRLETIIDYDKFFVLESGKLVEQGTLKELMRGKTIFKNIANEYGNDFIKRIEKMIKESRK